MSILVIVSYVMFSCNKFSLSYNKEDNPLKNNAKLACVTFFQPKVKIYNKYLFNRLLAEKGPAPPLGNFADIVYLKEQSFLIQMRDVCTLYAGA